MTNRLKKRGAYVNEMQTSWINLFADFFGLVLFKTFYFNWNQTSISWNIQTMWFWWFIIFFNRWCMKSEKLGFE